MVPKIEATIVFEKNYEQYLSKNYRIIINEGGTGSSKTVSLAQLFAIAMLKENGVQLTIARKTFPALRATAMKDFFNVIKGMGIYREEDHNKTENTYRYRNNEVDFVSVDEPSRVRSRRREYLWLNEANEFNKDDYRQLTMRTSKQIFMDYNPSHQFHWIYDDLQPRKDCIIIPSTYKDNPFLAKEIVKEIEGYKKTDKNYWRIYGLGRRGVAETLIYTHWQFCDKVPEGARIIYGLDFGYNNPTALVKIAIKDQDYYWEEKLYKRYLTNPDLIVELRTLSLTEEDIIYADSSEPDRIKELQDEGFNVVPCYKTKIKFGIDKIKSKKFFITKSSVNLLKELKSYSWKEKDGKKLEEPVKANDHLVDAGRYAIVTDGQVVEPSLDWL